MKVYFEKITEFSGAVVDFYTVLLDDDAFYEFEKFDNTDFPEHAKELQIMYAVIDEMQERGAKKYYFKEENAANAIPIVTQHIINANKKDFGIRLYCIRLTDNVVILLNGGIKTKKLPIDCPNVKQHFKNALKIAKQLDKAIIAKEINVQQKDCLQYYEIEI